MSTYLALVLVLTLTLIPFTECAVYWMSATEQHQCFGFSNLVKAGNYCIVFITCLDRVGVLSFETRDSELEIEPETRNPKLGTGCWLLCAVTAHPATLCTA